MATGPGRRSDSGITPVGVIRFIRTSSRRRRHRRAFQRCGVAPVFQDQETTSSGRCGDIPVESLSGVEYYAGDAQTPSEFAGEGSVCGTIVFWTK